MPTRKPLQMPRRGRDLPIDRKKIALLDSSLEEEDIFRVQALRLLATNQKSRIQKKKVMIWIPEFPAISS